MISVVIPVYNHALYVADAIHSCLLCPEVTEILIADDGSSDASRDVIRIFADRYPSLIRDLTDVPPTNIGAHKRINLLCSNASNEWIAILNSDDRFEPGRFRSLDRLSRYSKCDLVFGNCAIIGPDNEHLGFKYAFHSPEFSYPAGQSVDDIVRKGDWLLALLNQNFVATTSNIVFRKSLFETLCGFAPYRYIHDWDFVLRAAAAGKIAYNPNMWVNYRIHPTNTISENTFKVKDEVRSMFDDLLNRSDMKAALNARFTTETIVAALAGNQYLKNKPVLSLLVSDVYHPHVQALAEALPGAVLCVSGDVLPDDVQFVYAPDNLDELLDANDVINLMMALSVGREDFCLCSLELGNRTATHAKSLRDITLWRAETAQLWLNGTAIDVLQGRVVQIPRRTNISTKPLAQLFPANCVVEQTGATLRIAASSGGAHLDCSRDGLVSVRPNGLFARPDKKTTVFVLPSLVAVGGAENVLIEVMRQLKEEYAFVLICTEPLSLAQGSWVGRALEHAVAYYDLTELGLPENYLGAITWLKAAYAPELLFITNGSLWQMHHFGQLRKLFRDCAIVDQQVYDARFGWVEWLKYPSVRSSDRYIAVNKRIESRFLEEFDLSREVVDLIPHPINAERIERNLGTFERQACLDKFGLSEGRPIIAFVGRMTEQKRPELFLELAWRAQRDRVDAQFAMVGQGGLSETVRETIARLELCNVVRIENADPLEALYSVTDLLVITSEYEGLPLAMLEAMGTAVPVFSVNVGDIGVVLDKYVQEETYEPDMHPDQLYAAFRLKLDTLAEAKARAHQAAVQVRHDFSGAEIAKLYRANFDKAIQKYRATRRSY